MWYIYWKNIGVCKAAAWAEAEPKPAKPTSSAQALVLPSRGLEKPRLVRGFQAQPSRHITT